MFYSVYDYKRGTYDYFEAPGVPPATGAFRSPRGSTNTPECLAVLLPAGATPRGSGDLPKGTIAAGAGSALAALGFGGDEVEGVLKYAAVAVAAAWAGRRWWRK